jgi:ferredoxin-type protein NapH
LKRRITQFLSLIALNSAYWPWAQARWLCLPVLNCHACALAWFACPIGVMMHYSGWHIFPFVALGMVLTIGVVFGRLFCGWVCPFGTLQGLLYKIPSPKFNLPPRTGYMKYVVLAFMVFLIPFLWGESTQYSFCRICPAATLEAVIPGWFSSGFDWKGINTIARIAVLLTVIAAAILSSRSFCKILCPIGAILSPLNYFSLWKVKPPTHDCISCGRCDRTCTTHINPSKRIKMHVNPSDHIDCITCHACQPVCPARNDKKMDPKSRPVVAQPVLEQQKEDAHETAHLL